MRAAELFRQYIRQYRKSINPPYARKDLYPILGTVVILLAIPLTMFAVYQARELSSKAAGEGPVAVAGESKFISNELLIKIKKGSRDRVRSGKPADTGIASINRINKEMKVKKFERVAKIGKKSKKNAEIFAWYKVTLEGKGEKVAGKLDQVTGRISSKNQDNPALDRLGELIARFRSDPNIQAVEPNYVVSILREDATKSSQSAQEETSPPPSTTTQEVTPTSTTPNDPYYSSSGSWGQTYQDLYGIHKINAAAAWDQTTGSSNIVVAVVDTGVDRNHEDLAANMWTNPGETPGNGVDDDGNGYVDDYHGWDFVNDDNDPTDDYGHGTHCAGTIAAVGNNGKGVVGVNWTSKIMALKFLNSAGSGSIADGAAALIYAADMGAKVSSNSWGCNCQSSFTEDAVKYEHDREMVVVAAAGNSDNDALDHSPSSSDQAITVAASDYNDAKAYFSNWGEKIDVAAPGVDILSTRATVNPLCTTARTVGTNYCRISGTSMATPHVAGLAALLLAKNPGLNNEEVRQIIRTGADDLGAVGKDRDFGYGRINAAGSMALSNTHPLTPIITSPRSRTLVSGNTLQVYGSATGPNFASYRLEAGAGRLPTTWILVGSGSSQITNGLLATVDVTKLNEGLNILRLVVTDTSGKKYHFQVHDIEVDNFDAIIYSPSSYASLGDIDIVGSASTKNGITFDNYKLEWGVGASPTSWSTQGVSLTNSGQQPVNNGVLGTWRTSNLNDQAAYSLRLSVYGGNSKSDVVTYQVIMDSYLVEGWPKPSIIPTPGLFDTLISVP